MNISSGMKSNRMCAALTGLSVVEFNELVPVFASTLETMMRTRRSDRQRKFGGGRKSALGSIEEKLFFALLYLKCYPTVDVLSFLGGFDRSNACRNIQFENLLLAHVFQFHHNGSKRVPMRRDQDIFAGHDERRDVRSVIRQCSSRGIFEAFADAFGI